MKTWGVVVEFPDGECKLYAQNAEHPEDALRAVEKVVKGFVQTKVVNIDHLFNNPELTVVSTPCKEVRS